MLELVALSKRYGDVVALDGLSITVGPGRIHGFVGRNGAGKTTTMRITLGLARADAGEVQWRGRPVTAEDRRGFGYMPEERGLYPRMTALDQIVYFARLSGMGRAKPGRRLRRSWSRSGWASAAASPSSASRSATSSGANWPPPW